MISCRSPMALASAGPLGPSGCSRLANSAKSPLQVRLQAPTPLMRGGPAEPFRKWIYEGASKPPGAAVLDARCGPLGVAIRADTGSLTVGITHDESTRDGSQATLFQPGRALGCRMKFLFGEATGWHRRAGGDLVRALSGRCCEEGSAPRVVQSCEKSKARAWIAQLWYAQIPAKIFSWSPPILVSEGAHVGDENGSRGRDETSRGGVSLHVCWSLPTLP